MNTTKKRSCAWWVNPRSWTTTYLPDIIKLAKIASIWNLIFIFLDAFEGSRANDKFLSIMLYTEAGVCFTASIVALVACYYHSWKLACYSSTVLIAREILYIFDIIWIATHWQREELDEDGKGHGGYHLYAPCIFFFFRMPTTIIYTTLTHRLRSAKRLTEHEFQAVNAHARIDVEAQNMDIVA